MPAADDLYVSYLSDAIHRIRLRAADARRDREATPFDMFREARDLAFVEVLEMLQHDADAFQIDRATIGLDFDVENGPIAPPPPRAAPRGSGPMLEARRPGTAGASRLEIRKVTTGWFLIRFSASGECLLHTWHETQDDAKAQGAIELGVEDKDWTPCEPLVPPEDQRS